jgi:zinc transport system substrate-binding protein
MMAPASADTFRANADAAAARITALRSELQDQLRAVQGGQYIVFHDAYQYFEQAFDVPATGALTVSPEVQPSAKRLSQLRRRITKEGAACIFAEPQFEPKLLQTIAEGTGAKIGVLDPLGAAIPAGPGLYEQLLRGLATNLAQCLAPKRP